ncbi:PREDICTED: F-box only protein 16 isoform X4 [Lepidothrix coronata]|uniref:F-box only protein 16 isoform X4 n=1 Tax=Lepidothrix coronata TaxID=321398 RepID=A0A6J0IJ63_9PASS|nr:PREDICTED: F-box only protein 16 isoform X4 [Lepidothrix coronata]
MATGCGGEGGGGGGGGGGDVRGRKEEGCCSFSLQSGNWILEPLVLTRSSPPPPASMAFAPPRNTDGSKLQIKMSSWTPLNHQLMNDKVFEERRALLGKWVSWYWKYLSELDQLWMLKCLRFGWYINFCPTPFEQGIWKRHYIEMVRELWITRPEPLPKEEFAVVDVQPVGSDAPEAKLPARGRRRTKEKKELPPWRSSDRHPTDTVRYNYLDNWDPIEQARQARRKGGGKTPDLSRQAAERKRRAGRGSNQLQKEKSLIWLPADPECLPKPPARPSWAAHRSAGNLPPKAAAKALAQSSQWNAGIRPAPVRAPGPNPRGRGTGDVTRMESRAPSSPVFEAQPWHIPASSQGSDSE